MKIEKLPSGSYRIRKMYKGKTYTVVFDYKPTQKEAMQAMAAELDRLKCTTQLTFSVAAGNYIEMKRNVLSPRTVKEYSETIRRFPEWFSSMPISDIDQIQINKLINELSQDKSPKTIRNYHGFLTAVLGIYHPNLRINTTLPQKIKSEPYTPSREDVKRILMKVKDTPYEIPITLACFGLRRSEICALTLGDLDGDVLHITKAMVQNDIKEWVIKTTKTTSSTRDIIIPVYLADKIRGQGYICKCYPGTIARILSKVQNELGIPHFSLHKLRHYFASEMSALGIPEADILKMGGWETDHVMKSVYRHSMMDREEQAKRAATDKFQNVLFLGPSHDKYHDKK